MRRIKYYIIGFIFLSLPFNYSFGQSEDFNLWTSLSLEKKLSKDLDLNVDFENRLRDNLNLRDQTLAEVGISYSWKDISFGFIYRFTNKNEGGDDFSYGNRLSYQLSYAKEIDRFKLSLRGRYQNHFDNLINSENGYLPKNYFRSRMKILYNIKGIPIDPWLSVEPFYKIDNQEPEFYLSKIRYSFGANYKINKDNTVGIGYHYQNEMNTTDPLQKYVLAIKYKFEF